MSDDRSIVSPVVGAPNREPIHSAETRVAMISGVKGFNAIMFGFYLAID